MVKIKCCTPVCHTSFVLYVNITSTVLFLFLMSDAVEFRFLKSSLKYDKISLDLMMLLLIT